jgi:UDPglucose 6-dehydrogenase
MSGMTKPLIGFIGQGYIGKNYADDFEARGFQVVRYALEAEYVDNKKRIPECDIVFIAVPTPTTADGFDGSVVGSSLELLRDGSIAIIKSTIVPGTTSAFQAKYPKLTVLYSPEFLSEATAAHDAAHPFSNIIGMAADTVEHRNAADRIHAILPSAPYSLTCTSLEAELIKYSHNASGYVQVVLFNLMYDLAQKLGADWTPIQEALKADSYISSRYANPIHKSGRGAGGHCFIKDFAALRALYENTVHDPAGVAALAAVEEKNVSLLKDSGKDLDLLKGVYGSRI